MKQLLYIIIYILLFLGINSQLFAQEKIFDQIDTFIYNGQYNNAFYLLAKTNNKAQISNDTLTLIKINDYYYKIFQITYPSDVKKFLNAKINIEKKYLNSHTDEKLLNDLYNTYLALANYFENNNDYFYAINTYKNILQNSNFKDKYSQINLKIANNFTKLKDFAKAYYLINSTLEVATELNDSELIIESYFSRGNLYAQYALYPESINDLLTSLNLSCVLNNQEQKAKISETLADVLFSLEFYHKAAEFYSFVAQYYNNSNNRKKQSEINYKLGKSFFKAQQLDSSIVAFNKAIALSETNFNYSNNSLIYSYLGQIYLAKNDFPTANLYLTKAILLTNKSSDSLNNIDVFIAFGTLNLQKGDLTKALFYLLKAYKQVVKTNQYSDLKQISGLIAKIYKQKNDLKNALLFSEIYGKAGDTLSEIRNKITISKIETESLLKTKSFAYENKLQSLDKHRKGLQMWIIVLIISIVSLLVFLIFYFRKSKQLATVSRQLEIKNLKLNNQLNRNKILSLVAKNTSNSIFIIDTNWKVVWVNDVLLQTYQTTKHRIFKVFNGDFDKLTTGDYEKIKNACQSDKQPFTYKTSYNTDSKEIWLQTSISPVFENNEIKYYIGIENNITDIILAQKLIEKQNQSLEHNNKLLDIYNNELKDQK